MPIYKEHSTKSRDCDSTGAYLLDKKHAGPNEMAGPKVDFFGQVNGMGNDFSSTQIQMLALKASYEGDGEAFTHCSYSLRQGERFTPAQAQQAAEIHLKNQGLEGHLALWSVHKDTKNHHIHIMTCRIAPEPNAQDKYEIKCTGGAISNPTSGHTFSKLSGHAAEAEIRAAQGWAREKKARYDFVNGAFVKPKYTQTPTEAQAVKMGSRVKDAEAHTQTKHPKTILAEASRDILQASGKDKASALAALAAAGITYKDVNYTDNKGKQHVGGLFTSETLPKGIKLSSLPKDCSWIREDATSTPPPAPTPMVISSYSDAQVFIKSLVKTRPTEEAFHSALKEKGLAFEQTGKTGARIRFAPGTTGTVKLSDCNTSFLKLQKQFTTPLFSTVSNTNTTVNVRPEKNMFQTQPLLTLIETSKNIIRTSKSTAELEFALAAQGISLERATAKTEDGKEFTYGKLIQGKVSTTLKSLGEKDGKPLFTLSKIDQVFLAKDAARIFDTSTSYADAQEKLEKMGISYERIKRTIVDKGEEKEITLGKLTKGTLSTTTGMAGKEYQPSSLDAKYMPYDTAKTLYESIRLSPTPVQDLAAKGLTASDIDRIGRVGEKAEKGLQRKDKPTNTPQAKPQQQQSKTIIPTNMQEILDMIEQSAIHSASVAKANAVAAQAINEAKQAENRALAAEKALAELKQQIKPEVKEVKNEKQQNNQAVSPEQPTNEKLTNNEPKSPEQNGETAPDEPRKILTTKERIARARAEGIFDNTNCQPIDTGQAIPQQSVNNNTLTHNLK